MFCLTLQAMEVNDIAPSLACIAFPKACMTCMDIFSRFQQVHRCKVSMISHLWSACDSGICRIVIGGVLAPPAWRNCAHACTWQHSSLANRRPCRWQCVSSSMILKESMGISRCMWKARVRSVYLSRLMPGDPFLFKLNMDKAGAIDTGNSVLASVPGQWWCRRSNTVCYISTFYSSRSSRTRFGGGSFAGFSSEWKICTWFREVRCCIIRLSWLICTAAPCNSDIFFPKYLNKDMMLSQKRGLVNRNTHSCYTPPWIHHWVKEQRGCYDSYQYVCISARFVLSFISTDHLPSELLAVEVRESNDWPKSIYNRILHWRNTDCGRSSYTLLHTHVY